MSAHMRRKTAAVAWPGSDLSLSRSDVLEPSAENMDGILHILEAALQQIQDLRDSPVKMARPEHLLLVNLDAVNKLMLATLRSRDPGRRMLKEIFGGDGSGTGRLEAILSAVASLERIAEDSRVAACNNTLASTKGLLTRQSMETASLRSFRKAQPRQRGGSFFQHRYDSWHCEISSPIRTTMSDGVADISNQPRKAFVQQECDTESVEDTGQSSAAVSSVQDLCEELRAAKEELKALQLTATAKAEQKWQAALAERDTAHKEALAALKTEHDAKWEAMLKEMQDTNAIKKEHVVLRLEPCQSGTNQYKQQLKGSQGGLSSMFCCGRF
eukprot:TRINITY_DN108264_c0_g1_i1.p1 TRINITY_DN108264_c0_g1~~TRINITY_DN108264_c0_g1_i1.p1  ORF type:complete len:328 (-),score=70.88 TRINITY_DN108264_c0_g1_i1:50-1033(-)